MANERDPADHVDPLAGTAIPRWTLFPGVSLPAGMVKISPDNQRKGYQAGYDYKIENIAGFSHIHSRTMGGLRIMPVCGTLKTSAGTPDDPDSGYRSRFSHQNETAKPGYYSVFLDDYGIKAELTSTLRAAFQRYTFPGSDSARILLDLKIPTDNGYEILESCIRKVSDREIEGFSRQRGMMGAGHNLYTIHFVVRFSKAFRQFGGWLGDRIMRDISEIRSSYDDEGTGAFLDFRTRENEIIMLQSGISLVSIDQARLNLEKELDPSQWDFDSVCGMNRRAWNDLLGSIRVEGGSPADLKMFYTCLYRVFAGMTTWSDVNGKYVDMHENIQQIYDPDIPVYGCLPPGPGTIAVNQLLTLCRPDMADNYVKSMLHLHSHGGWFPDNSEGIGYPGLSASSHVIPLLAAARQKGIHDYDIQDLYRAVQHDLTSPGQAHAGGGYSGRKYLEEYLLSDSVTPAGPPACIIREYAYHDWVMSQMARASGNVSDYMTFARRAFKYKNVSGPEEDVMQNFVPHDAAGLITVYGKEEFTVRLEKEISRHLAHAGQEEAIADLLKKMLYSGDCPPVQSPLQAAYLFNFAGAPWLAQKWLREILSGYGEHHSPLSSVLCYPEQSAALYALGAIGLFQTDGGTSARPCYEIGSPLFDRITIRLDGKYYPGGKFVIEAGNNSSGNIYVRKAALNGKELTGPWFPHTDLSSGGNLVLRMGSRPDKTWGIRPENAPPSMSSGMTEAEIGEIMKYDRFAEDLELWNKAMKAYYYHRKEHFETLPNADDEIIFLGNSITDQAEWSEMFGNPRIKNRGIGGDVTDGILERLDEVTESRPLKIFLMIGTNDLSEGRSVDYITENFKRIIERIRESTPATKIYIQSVLPVDDAVHYTRRNSDIIAVNDRLKEIASLNGLEYIDLFSLFRLENNRLNPEYSYDGLHLNGKGYQVWKEAIRKYVEE